ncbi:MAG: XkdX family protein [Liquorilactobacillus ghanensis]|uniref:XkdX family protein n=1 Tax=Liquorilactobacillus ghanensis TaxID=399370 RepID=UPI0039EC7FA6
MSEYIKEYYLLGLYTDADLDIFVEAQMLTADEETAIKAAKTATTSTTTQANS